VADHEPCKMHDSVLTITKTLRESCRQLQQAQQALDGQIKEAVERQESMEGTLAQSILDLRQGMDDVRANMTQYAEALQRVESATRSVTNGGLTAALETTLPAVLSALGAKEAARCSMWRDIVVAMLGAAGALITSWMTKG